MEPTSIDALNASKQCLSIPFRYQLFDVMARNLLVSHVERASIDAITDSLFAKDAFHATYLQDASIILLQ